MATTLVSPTGAPARLILRPLQAFLHTEAAGGIVLLIATVVALTWANSPWDASYADLWHRELALDSSLFRIDLDLHAAVNDGLMAIFFFVVGLEIKRELVHGELASARRAVLPVAAALGGMVLPALIFVAFNAGGDGAKGWGIPMATDIAFAVGVLALLGSRVPLGLKIFLLAVAIVDDLGAILVIALFYSHGFSLEAFTWAIVMVAVIYAVQRAGVSSVDVYVVLGILLWVAVFKSGVHATIAGVLLALLTPSHPRVELQDAEEQIRGLESEIARAKETGESPDVYLRQIERVSRGAASPLDRLEETLHPWVSFVIVPIFALANAGLVLGSDVIREAASSPITLGVATGLVLGKGVGIFVASWLTTRIAGASLPDGVHWPHVAGAALLGGIGFTVSLFVTGLAYPNSPVHQADARIGILVASIIAGAGGFLVLRFTTRPGVAATEAG